MKTFVVSEFLNGNFYVRAVCSTRERAEEIHAEITIDYNRVYIEEMKLDTGGAVELDTGGAVEGKFWCVHLTPDGYVLQVDDHVFATIPGVNGPRDHGVQMVYVRATDIMAAIKAARKLQKKFKDREIT